MAFAGAVHKGTLVAQRVPPSTAGERMASPCRTPLQNFGTEFQSIFEVEGARAEGHEPSPAQKR